MWMFYINTEQSEDGSLLLVLPAQWEPYRNANLLLCFVLHIALNRLLSPKQYMMWAFNTYGQRFCSVLHIYSTRNFVRQGANVLSRSKYGNWVKTKQKAGVDVYEPLSSHSITGWYLRPAEISIGLWWSCDTLHRKQCCRHSAFMGTSPVCTNASFLPPMEPCQVRDHVPMAQVLKATGITWTLQMFTWAVNHCWKQAFPRTTPLQRKCSVCSELGETNTLRKPIQEIPQAQVSNYVHPQWTAEYGLERSANGRASQQSYMEICLNWKIWQPIIAIHRVASFPWP